MSDGILKAEKDYSKDADKIIPEAESLAKKDLQKAIDKILGLEKQARQVQRLLRRFVSNAKTFPSHRTLQPPPGR